jgi:hypothetical protein
LLELLHLSGAFRDSSYHFHPTVISVKKCIPAALTDFDQEWQHARRVWVPLVSSYSYSRLVELISDFSAHDPVSPNKTGAVLHLANRFSTCVTLLLGLQCFVATLVLCNTSV